MFKDKKIFLMRHGQSWANVGDKTVIDAPLTVVGRSQCAQVYLTVDYLICSPMRRTVESLHYSNIKRKYLVFDEVFREKKSEISDHCLLEEFSEETESEFYQRCRIMADKLLSLLNEYDSIGVVCHGCVIRGLTGIMPDNAQIIIPDLDVLRLIADGRHYYQN